LTATLEPKRLELLRELVPHVSTIGALLDPNFPPYEGQLHDLREAARSLDLQVQELRASTDAEIDVAFETVARQRIAALTVVAGPFFDTRREKLVALAVRHGVPTMYHFREFPVAGGLMSYGIDARVIYRHIGVYAGAILKGETPAELPVLLPPALGELQHAIHAAKHVVVDANLMQRRVRGAVRRGGWREG
jgi:putative ABC transport system substrate-binding protein